MSRHMEVSSDIENTVVLWLDLCVIEGLQVATMFVPSYLWSRTAFEIAIYTLTPVVFEDFNRRTRSSNKIKVVAKKKEG